VWCNRLAASASSGRRSWALSHQLLDCCLRWGYCLHFFTSLRRRLVIVALPSAAAVMADLDCLRPALIRDNFRAASPTPLVVEGSGTVCSSSNCRSILWAAAAALVRAWSIVSVVDFSWRGIPSTVHVSRSSWTPLYNAESSTKREEFLTIGRGWPPTTEVSRVNYTWIFPKFLALRFLVVPPCRAEGRAGGLAFGSLIRYQFVISAQP